MICNWSNPWHLEVSHHLSWADYPTALRDKLILTGTILPLSIVLASSLS
jgi:hypothetical protein